MSERRVLRGAVWGARVAGSAFGTLAILAFGVGVWGSVFSWTYIPLFGFFAYWVLRPWWMGVWVTSTTVVVKSWFRRYEISKSTISSIEVPPYQGLVNISPVGYVPLVGKIRMLRIRTDSGRPLDLPATVGRKTRVVELAQLLREQVGDTRAA